MRGSVGGVGSAGASGCEAGGRGWWQRLVAEAGGRGWWLMARGWWQRLVARGCLRCEPRSSLSLTMQAPEISGEVPARCRPW